MKERLVSFIQGVRSNPRVNALDEAATKQALILRPLSILGWDPFDVDEVYPEYITVAGKRVDYALRVSNSSKVFIEVKRLNEDLEPHQEQLLNYSFQEGVPLAILTNGLTWWFYRPPNEGSWEQRRFYSIDFSEQEPPEIATRLMDFLCRDNVASGKAIEHADAVYKSKKKSSVLESTLPKAWNKIISDPDEKLMELIGETTERLSGFRPEIGMVESFLKTHPNLLILDEAVSRLVRSEGSRKSTVGEAGPGDSGRETITSFTFRGKRYPAKTWKDLLITLSEVVYQLHPSEFSKVLSLHGTKRKYYARSSEQMREPRKVGNSGYFVETHWSAKSMRKLSMDLLALFGHGEDDVHIETY